MRNAVRSVWTEPRVPRPPVRVWRDWAVVAVVVSTAVLEDVLRQDLPWRPVAVLEAATLAFALLWRRMYPLATVAVVFGVVIVVDVVSVVAGTRGPVGLYAMAYLLLLLYALFRWGSGREAVIGSGIALAAAVVGTTSDYTGVADTIVGFVILVFPAVLGALVRSWATSRRRELDQVRLREREQLARELHDTVAHHVSAMVIRAQAGRVVAASRPGAAVEALEVIEAEGSRTLAEMRTMVGALRDGEDAGLAPQSGMVDIERLTHSQGGDQPRVEVHLTGDLDDLRPSLGAAIYRITQESITNARRHARHASRIDVLVTGDADCVRLTVRDDGDAVFPVRAPAGYGVVGMTERASLLGGTLEVGPGPDRGWVVTAVLPRVGTTG